MKRMKKGQGVAWLAVLLICLVGLGYFAYTIIVGTARGEGNQIKLGLDLDGGVSITYQVVGDTPTTEELNDTVTKLSQRIENDLGAESSTTEASVYPVGDDRITVEIPGVTDANEILEQLGKPGALYFIRQTDDAGNTNYSYDATTGQYKLNYDLQTLEENGSVVLSGSDIKDASAAYQSTSSTGAQQPVVELQLNDSGTEAFAEATTAAAEAGQTIGIYYDGQFVSVPTVNEAITEGQCVISGMSSYEEAEQLASYIRIGGLDLQLEELQSEIVGAQLGQDALDTSFLAAAVGLIVVMVFMIAVYRIPGVAAALALALYTELMLAILSLYDITLTLPGIAGIILSIGMAVDANVIIFARIQEEIADGGTVATAIDTGFHKALSAILDGNITTLIAAAVLGIFGSGTVKGFAITLALGVILSMFTALVITRIFMNAFYAVGMRKEKLYGKPWKVPHFDFVGHRKIFFTISGVVIVAGFIGMAVFAARGDGELNYSLEFMGGTSTTVTFDRDYTIDEIDEQIVPVVSEVTGDNDIQTQKVDGTNQVIIKTRSLELEERQELETALEEHFGVTTRDIQSQNIGSAISSEMRTQSVVAVVIAAFFMLLYIWFRFKDIRFAGSAILALVHDVLCVLTLYVLVRISVGGTFIACMLTIIGYSINDTIVTFDRIRENRKALVKETPGALKTLVNDSITQTLSRTINTSLTTVVMVISLLIFGVSTIRDFALPLMAGILVGTYSSICLASGMWYMMRVRVLKKEAAAAVEDRGTGEKSAGGDRNKKKGKRKK